MSVRPSGCSSSVSSAPEKPTTLSRLSGCILGRAGVPPPRGRSRRAGACGRLYRPGRGAAGAAAWQQGRARGRRASRARAAGGPPLRAATSPRAAPPLLPKFRTLSGSAHEPFPLRPPGGAPESKSVNAPECTLFANRDPWAVGNSAATVVAQVWCAVRAGGMMAAAAARARARVGQAAAVRRVFVAGPRPARTNLCLYLDGPNAGSE